MLFRYHVPGLGSFESTSDADGSPTISAHYVDRAISTTTGRDDLVAALYAHTGRPWRDAIEALRATVPA